MITHKPGILFLIYTVQWPFLRYLVNYFAFPTTKKQEKFGQHRMKDVRVCQNSKTHWRFLHTPTTANRSRWRGSPSGDIHFWVKSKQWFDNEGLHSNTNSEGKFITFIELIKITSGTFVNLSKRQETFLIIRFTANRLQNVHIKLTVAL